MFSTIKRSLRKLLDIHEQQLTTLDRISELNIQQQKTKTEITDTRLLMGKLLGELNEARFKKDGFSSINDYEFKVFSQFGDDGIMQFLVNRVQPEQKTFIEFGVENYDESNTKFLLINNNWRGLIFDGGKQHIDYIKKQEYFWRQYLTAEAHFITKENINELISSNGFKGEVGILHIDIDGNDYWVLDAIDVVSADILILEYNSVYGKDNAWTIPYKADFYRTDAHFSNLYWGASLKALYLLAKKKGYSFVGCNIAGNNAFFIKSEIVAKKQLEYLVVDIAKGFKDSHFRESRDSNRGLTFLAGDQRLKAINGCIVFDVEKNQTITIS